MKHLLSILILTLMLRVWWTETTFMGSPLESYTGIVVGSFGDSSPGVFIVRLDNGKMTAVGANRITKSEFVEVK